MLPDTTRLMNALEDTSDADLVETAANLRRTRDLLNKQLGITEAELARRMAASGAKRVLADEWEAEVAYSRTYRWDAEQLMAWIGEHRLNPVAQFVDEVLIPAHVEHKVNTNKVLALAKSLGDVGKDIELCYTVEDGPPRFTYKERR